MSGSFKDALEKSGLATPEPAAPKPESKAKAKWKEELPTEHAPHVPFEAPALTKPKGPPQKKR